MLNGRQRTEICFSPFREQSKQMTVVLLAKLGKSDNNLYLLSCVLFLFSFWDDLCSLCRSMKILESWFLSVKYILSNL